MDILRGEGLEKSLRYDAYVFLVNAIKNGLDAETLGIFKHFQESGDSSFLVSRVMSTSEEMLQAFNESNFANKEIGSLYKLRRNRS